MFLYVNVRSNETLLRDMEQPSHACWAAWYMVLAAGTLVTLLPSLPAFIEHINSRVGLQLN